MMDLGGSKDSRRMTLSGYPQCSELKADNAYEHRIHPAYYSYLRLSDKQNKPKAKKVTAKNQKTNR
jgi:hypothetical protein